jgi:hypothetical protein
MVMVQQISGDGSTTCFTCFLVTPAWLRRPSNPTDLSFLETGNCTMTKKIGASNFYS